MKFQYYRKQVLIASAKLVMRYDDQVNECVNEVSAIHFRRQAILIVAHLSGYFAHGARFISYDTSRISLSRLNSSYGALD